MRGAKEGLAPDLARHHRTIFISDVHLGTPGCKAELLADFLTHNDCRTLYLVGDVVDFWRLKRSWFWSAAHSRVIDAVLAKVKGGTRVLYVPGNHDEAFRDYCGVMLAGVELLPEALHRTADGREFLVIHGDAFDGIVTYARWLALLGDRAYAAALWLNDVLNIARRKLGLPHWSLAAFLKRKVKNAASFISDFEHAAARAARLRGADGIVCGHIHNAQIKQIDGVLYCNDGDWVESCTAIVEDARGRVEIIEWTSFASERIRAARPAARKVAIEGPRQPVAA